MTAAGPTELTEQGLGKLIEWQKKIHSIPSHVERGGQGRDRVADIHKLTIQKLEMNKVTFIKVVVERPTLPFQQG